MAKIGISIKIDVTKIEKQRLFKGQKGTYLDLTTFIDTDNQDQYGNHGFISQSTSKEEREAGVQTTILGNTKVFYSDLNGGHQAVAAQVNQSPQQRQAPPPPPQGQPQGAYQQPPQPQAPNQGYDDFDDGIPFMRLCRESMI